MENVSSIRKVFELAYKTKAGDFHREVCFEDQLDVMLDNLAGDNCRVLYCREADPTDVSVFIITADSAQLRHVIELATSELYQRLLNSEMKQYRKGKYSFEEYKKEIEQKDGDER